MNWSVIGSQADVPQHPNAISFLYNTLLLQVIVLHYPYSTNMVTVTDPSVTLARKVGPGLQDLQK